MDVEPISSQNHITKYADNVSLLVSEQNDVDVESQFYSVSKRAKVNKLVVNMAKTKELVFHQPNARNHHRLSCLVLNAFCVLN